MHRAPKNINNEEKGHNSLCPYKNKNRNTG